MHDVVATGDSSQRTADKELYRVVSDIMYANGDDREPKHECVDLLVRQLHNWQKRHIQLVSAERQGGVTLCRKRLREHFPADYEEHVLLQKLKRQARKAQEEDEELAAADPADDEEGEEQPAEEEDRVRSAMASRHGERRAFQDERTREMDAEEYESFAERRQAASLQSVGVARKVADSHGLLTNAVTRANGRMVPAYSFFLRLATSHLGGIVEAANRAAHGDGRLHPPRQPLALPHYLQAVREEYAKWPCGGSRQAE